MLQSSTTSMDYSTLIRQAPQLQPYYLTTVAPCGEQVQVALGNAATWRKFSRQKTEMIVTKVGRRMFPSLSLDIRGLDPVKKYEVYVTLMLADPHTLKYQRGVWLANGLGETYPPPGCSAGLGYVHPDSPAPGKHWTRQEVNFMRLKLTNKLDGFVNEPSRNGSMIFVYSMHKYLPIVHIRELAKNDAGGFYTALTFPGTEFITVTAYQNPELTDLKIQFNPYAKGIRNQGDRSGPLLIESFRPTVQALREQLHLTNQLVPDSSATPSDSKVEFGAYPQQTDSAYGHWSQQQHPGRDRRLYRPYQAHQSSPMTLPISSTSTTSSAENVPTNPYDYQNQYFGYQLPHYEYQQQQQLEHQPQPYYYQPGSHLYPHQFPQAEIYTLTSASASASAGLAASAESYYPTPSAQCRQQLPATPVDHAASLLSTPIHHQPQQQAPDSASSLSAASFGSPPTNC